MSTLIKTNLAILAYLILVWLFMIFDWIQFGFGSGDLIFYYGVPVVFVTLGILQLFALKKAPKKNMNRFILISGMFCVLMFTYYFTFGRGLEQPWNGQVFYF